MRVAVSQFATTVNVQDNLASCIRMITKASACKPALIVLPQFCNTLPWYQDHNQAWNDALFTGGAFLAAIAEQAKTHNCYIVLNVTLRRDLLRAHQDGSIKSNISVTSCLFSPLGELIHQQDSNSLTGHESDFFTSSNKDFEIAKTPLSLLGFLSGNDDTSFEASRDLALSGAQILCNSISSFTKDQSNLHDPARACENKVFLVTANKIGSLLPKEQSARMSAKNDIPQEYLQGVGQSQIVSPCGKVLAKITNNEEGCAFADIDLAEASNKLRPDGSEHIKQRRTELYQKLALSVKPAAQQHHDNKIPETSNVAIFATYKSNEQAIEDVCHYIENNLSDIIQLPELFFVAEKEIASIAMQVPQIERLSKQLIIQVSSVLRPFQYVCTSLVLEGKHQAVLISEQGLFATQQQLHFCQRYQWAALGNELNTIDLPLEQGNISVAMLTGDDANLPELVNLAALRGIHLLLVPFDIQESCEVEYDLLARAAENRICIVAASREKSFVNDLPTELVNTNNKNKVKTQKSTGFIATLTKDIPVLTALKSRKFDGHINKPLVKHQHGKITKALIHPKASCNKVIVK